MSKTALIITSHIEHITKIRLRRKFDLTVSADGGYLYARALGVTPEVYIGDHDSAPLPPSGNMENRIVLPTVKDVTDSEAAIDYCIEKGCSEVFVLGGIGGRLDHTLGNLGIMAKHCKHAHIVFLDGQNRTFMLHPGEHRIEKNDFKYLGLIAYGGSVGGLTIKGCKYELSDKELVCETTLGVSNEITGNEALISFSSGKLLVVQSQDIKK